jgi:hypothetical protein
MGSDLLSGRGYRLCLEDGDELFVLLFREMGHPEHVIRSLIGTGRDDYMRENHYAIKKRSATLNSLNAFAIAKAACDSTKWYLNGSPPLRLQPCTK